MKNILILIVIILLAILVAGIVCVFAIPDDSNANPKNWGNKNELQIGKAYQFDLDEACELFDNDKLEYAAIAPIDEKQATLLGKVDNLFIDESPIITYVYNKDNKTITLFFDKESVGLKFNVDLDHYMLKQIDKPIQKCSLKVQCNMDMYPYVVTNEDGKIITDLTDINKGDRVSISMAYPIDKYKLEMKVDGNDYSLGSYFSIEKNTIVNIMLYLNSYKISGISLNCHINLHGNDGNNYVFNQRVPADTALILDVTSNDLSLYEFSSVSVNGVAINENDLPYSFIASSDININCKYVEISHAIPMKYAGEISFNKNYNVEQISDILRQVDFSSGNHVLASNKNEQLMIKNHTIIDSKNNTEHNIPALVYSKNGEDDVILFLASGEIDLGEQCSIGWQDVSGITFINPITYLDTALSGWNGVFILVNNTK